MTLLLISYQNLSLFTSSELNCLSILKVLPSPRTHTSVRVLCYLCWAPQVGWRPGITMLHLLHARVSALSCSSASGQRSLQATVHGLAKLWTRLTGQALPLHTQEEVRVRNLKAWERISTEQGYCREVTRHGPWASTDDRLGRLERNQWQVRASY